MQPRQACPGNFRVNRGKWFIPVGMTKSQYTYCEWCISNRCVELEEGYTVKSDLNNCLCDCSQKHSHNVMQPYDCGNHKNDNDTATDAKHSCRLCWRNTAVGNERYCQACSALFGICGFCGIKPDGLNPFRAVAKMLTHENGRYSRRSQSSSEDSS